VIKNSGLRMTGKYPTIIIVNILCADFSSLKLDEYLQLLATNMYENEHPLQEANKTAKTC
jgi:hypothetical protein